MEYERKSGVKIITVSGAQSDVGKTSFIEKLLRIFKGWACIKVTVTHEGVCPRGKDCGVCARLKSDFDIITDKNIVEEKGKDTQRFKAAGAGKVIWLRARPQGLRQGIKAALLRLEKEEGLIIEGTSVLKYLKPDAAILVKGKNSLLKNSAQAVLKKIDLVLTV